MLTRLYQAMVINSLETAEPKHAMDETSLSESGPDVSLDQRLIDQLLGNRKHVPRYDSPT